MLGACTIANKTGGYEIKPDILVTLGGGSITDATKILSLIDSNAPSDGEYSLEYLDTLSGGHGDSSINPAGIPIIAIPTILSAGEYSSLAAAVDPRTSQKRLFHHPSIAPKVVILDPALAKMTPDWVWFSTGIRAIDHCVETIASSFSTRGASNEAARGLEKLISGLLRCKNGGDDTSARLDAMIGARLSITAVDAGIPMGGSHAIGLQLGVLGVPHGYTSCVMCPFVMRYNLPANSEKQAWIASLIWRIPEAAHVLENHGLRGKLDSDLSEVLDKLFRDLGMPRSLKEVGIDPGENEVILQEIARKTLCSRWAKRTPGRSRPKSK